jgi:HSP20 family molecular chaperone IbpA
MRGRQTAKGEQAMMFDTLGRSNWPDPLRELRRMQDELSRGYSAQARMSEEFPPLNLWTGEQGAVLTAALPGVAPDDLEITVHQDTLTLRASAGRTPPRARSPGTGASGATGPSGAPSLCRSASIPSMSRPAWRTAS